MTAETRDDAEAVTVPSGTSLWRRIDRGDLTRTLFVAVCAAGVALGWAFAMPALGQLLRSTGIMRLDAGLAAGPVVCLGAAFLALPVLLSLLLMRRARRITSRDLLAE